MHLFGTLVDNNGENFVIYRFIFLDLPIQSGYTRDGWNLFHGRWSWRIAKSASEWQIGEIFGRGGRLERFDAEEETWLLPLGTRHDNRSQLSLREIKSVVSFYLRGPLRRVNRPRDKPRFSTRRKNRGSDRIPLFKKKKNHSNETKKEKKIIIRKRSFRWGGLEPSRKGRVENRSYRPPPAPGERRRRGHESRSNGGWRGGYRGRGRENNLNRGRLHSFGDRFWNGFSPWSLFKLASRSAAARDPAAREESHVSVTSLLSRWAQAARADTGGLSARLLSSRLTY